MEQLTVTRTKNYLVLKIPLKAVKEGEFEVSPREKRAILEGLKALEEGRTSRTFKNAREAITFLRSL